MSFVPHSPEDRRAMLRTVGVSDVEALFADIPARLRLDRPLQLPDPLVEWQALRLLRALAAENAVLTSFAGAGIYDHHVPAAVDHLLRRSEFYTAYTPYQAEVSQGTLQSIYEFQTMVCELTGMDVANASIYDGASATGEAALMALSVTRRGRILLSGGLHPHYRKVVETYVSGQDAEVKVLELGEGGSISAEALAEAADERTACFIAQSPNFFGVIEELEPLAASLHDAGGILIVAVADPAMLAVLRPPGACGADIVAAEGQAFGNAPSYGGPVVGLFAARERYVRKMPGRIVGATVDAEGRRGYVLTLQTREQQIRREKATSNICTNQGLNALAATIYLATVGREGLRRVAESAIENAHYARRSLIEAGVELLHPAAPVAREFAVRTAGDSRRILQAGIERGILPGVSLARFPALDVGDGLLLAFTEKHERAEIDALVDLLRGADGTGLERSAAEETGRGGAAAQRRRLEDHPEEGRT